MQSVTSLISTTMVLVLLGVVTLFSLTAREIADSVRENLTLTLVLEDDATTRQAEALQEMLLTKPYVANIEYISAEQALEEQVADMGVDPTDLLGANPFSISMEMKVHAQWADTDSLAWIAQELRDNELVQEVTYQKQLVESLNLNLRRITTVLLAVAGLLVLVSMSLIHSTVRMNIFSHRFQIYTMKLVGARWGFIRRPFMLRSMKIGLAAATVAMGILAGGVRWALHWDEAITTFITLRSLLLTTATVYACGLIITLLCTYWSVTQYLHKRANELY